MNSRKEEDRLRHAIDTTLSGLADDPWLARHVLTKAKGEEKVKKKLSIGFILAMVVILAAVSVAVAATVNLFEKFGQSEQRFAEIASQSLLQADTPVTTDSTKNGQVTAAITNAYYDGEALLIGYTVQSRSTYEHFIPTTEQLSQMQPTDAETVEESVSSTGDYADELKQAQQSGTPWGMVSYSITVSDHTYANEKVDLGPWVETEDRAQEGYFAAIRDLEDLPEEVKGLDELSISIAVHQNVLYSYFDGNAYYYRNERTELPAMTATVHRTAHDVVQLMGFGMLKETKICVTVDASEVHLSAKITAVDGALPELAPGVSYDLRLVDGTGFVFSANAEEQPNESSMLFTFDGNGKTPEVLDAYVMILSEEGEIEAVHVVLEMNG